MSKKTSVGFYPDVPMLFLTLTLVCIGLLMVFSSTTIESLKAGDPFLYFKKQMIYVILGFGAMVFAMRFDHRRYREWVGIILGAAFLLLLVLFIPHVGRTAGGATRWIDLGPVSFQPSEFAKLALVIYMADFMARKKELIFDFVKGILPVLLVVGAACVLVLKQPDLGTVLVMFGSFFIMLYLAGARLSHLAALASCSAAGVFLLSILSPYRWKRIAAFIDPWQDPRGIGFHIIQSLIAVGSGGLFGFGLGNSRQKFLYLPEQYTDFIFAVFCEEWGFVGALVLIGLFIAFISRGLRICRNAPDKFSYLLAGGLISGLALQAVINMGVVVGIVPTTGIPLPFISYGGTSLVVSLYSVGILLNISSQKVKK